jgi:hypothetical protein
MIRHFAGRTSDTTKFLGQDWLYLGQDSKWVPPDKKYSIAAAQ